MSVLTITLRAPIICIITVALFAGCLRQQPPTSKIQPSSVKTPSSNDPVHTKRSVSPSVSQADRNLNADSKPPFSDAGLEGADSQQAEGKIKASTSESEITLSQPAKKQEKSEIWTSQRLIVLAPGGPLIVDVAVNVQGKSLQEIYFERLEGIVQELNLDFSKTVMWADVFAHPLVRSGWLGNLLPSDENRDQLLNMYDQARDNRVGKEELLEFLTRGLIRNPRIGLSEVPDNSADGMSIFDPCDRDGDGELSKAEVEQLEKSLMRFDFDGDFVISRQELTAIGGQTDQRMSMADRSIVTSSSFLPWNSAEPTSSASDVLQHFTFLDKVARENWHAWPAERWQALDANGDQALTRTELIKLGEAPSHVELLVRLPGIHTPLEKSMHGQDNSSLRLDANLNSSATTQSWQPNGANAGRFHCDTCILRVKVNGITDEFLGFFTNQLRTAMNDPQTAAVLRAQLELGSAAIEVVDADKDSKLSDSEINSAWRWLLSFRQLRIAARMRVANSAWLELLDRDQNSLITQAEILHMVSSIHKFDFDKDSRISHNEVPLVASIDFENTLAAQIPMRTNAAPTDEKKPESAAPRWFSAMDSNQDGAISPLEFLGDSFSFATLDTNKDGIISPFEVYEHQ